MRYAFQRTENRVFYYKGDGDPMVCCSCWIKLPANALKVIERVFEHRTKQQIDMQFGFVKSKRTIDAILS